MKQLFFTLFLFFLAQNVLAQEICRENGVELPEIDEDISNTLEAIPGDHQFNLCVISLCGTPSENTSMGEYNSSISVNLSNRGDGNQESREMSDTQIEAVSDIIAGTYDNIGLFFDRATSLNFDQIDEVVNYDDDWEILIKDFARDSLTNVLESLQDGQLELSSVCPTESQNCPLFLVHYFRAINTAYEENPMQVISDIKSNLKVDLTRHLPMREALERSSDFIAESIADSNPSQAQQLRERASLEYLSDDNALDIYESLIARSGSQLGSRHGGDSRRVYLYCQSEGCRSGLTHALKEQIETAESEFNQTFEQNQTAYLAECVSALQNRSSGRSDISSFLERAPNLFEFFVDSSLFDLSGETKEGFQNFYNNRMRVAAGSASEKPIDQVLTELRQNMSEQVKSLDRLDFRDLLDMAGQLRRNTGDVVTESCRPERDFQNYGDSFRGDQDAISELRVSYFSCSHHEQGDQVFYHELGHAFSFFMNNISPSSESRAKFLEERRCVTSSYDRLGVEARKSYRWSHEGDVQYTEEDHADLIATRAGRGYETLYSCSLFRSEDNQYQGLEFRPHAGDPHSHEFVRLLREARYKGRELSAACRASVDRAPENLLNRCY